MLEHVSPGCIIDGEVVIWTGDRLDFSAVQSRLAAGKRFLPVLMEAHPASFVAFDVLAVAGHDARDLVLSGRRALLEELAAGWTPRLSLSPITADYSTVVEWFKTMPATGVEGLVVKGAGQPYEGDVRQWLKVRHWETLDVVCAAS